MNNQKFSDMRMELNRTNSSNADQLVRVGGNLTFGGALTVTNLGPAPVNGDVFDLFDSSGFNGAFASFSLPPGGTAHWNTNLLLVNGSLRFTNNHPSAPNHILNVTSGLATNLAIFSAATPPTDPDPGDILLISFVSPPTHGVATTDGTNITYSANFGYAGFDSFSYTVTDNFGGSATATISVNATTRSGFNTLDIELLTTDLVRLTFLGIPGTNYALDWRTNLTIGDWTPVATNPADPQGYCVSTNQSNLPENYYRTRRVP